MTYNFDGYNYLIRLEMGERLSEAIEQFANETTIEGAWLSGLGAATEVELGYYNLGSKEYQWKTFPQLMEVVSLTGNLASDEQGKTVFHLHGVLAGDDYQTVGGHIKDLIAGATLELFVHRSYQPIHRKHDETTGLQLLDLDGKSHD